MAILETRGLTKEFGGLRALDEVDISVEEGELVSLIGPNGSGKSTLINTITGRLEPTEGDVHYNGEDIVGLAPNEIAQRGVGRTFQTASIFPERTVRENIEIAAHASEEGSFKMNFLRRRDSFDEVLDRTERVLETIELDDQGEMEAQSLPYGDKRRLEVAIGLATGPDLMFMDEPTAGMSPGETAMTVELIERLRDELGMTIFLVEHDMDVIFGISDRVFVLNEGALIAEGPPSEIRESEIVRRAYLGSETV